MVFDENYTIPKMVKDTAEKYPEVVAQYKRIKNGEFEPILYRELYQYGLDFGAALLSLGVKREDPVGIIADNSAEWLHADLGIMGIGAIDVPRGCDATLIDLEQILAITEAKLVIAENSAQINKLVSLKDKLPCLTRVICFEKEIKDDVAEAAKKAGIEILFFANLMKEGQKWRIEVDDPPKMICTPFSGQTERGYFYASTLLV